MVNFKVGSKEEMMTINKIAHRRRALRPHDDGYSVVEKYMKVLLVIATFMLLLMVGMPR